MSEIIYGAVWAFFILSIIANYALLRFIKLERIQNSQKVSELIKEKEKNEVQAYAELQNAIAKTKDECEKEPEKTYDVKALLADLTTGSALIRMERIDPHDVLLHSPRQAR